MIFLVSLGGIKVVVCGDLHHVWNGPLGDVLQSDAGKILGRRRRRKRKRYRKR